jgi:hypothetical protein
VRESGSVRREAKRRIVVFALERHTRKAMRLACNCPCEVRHMRAALPVLSRSGLPSSCDRNDDMTELIRPRGPACWGGMGNAHGLGPAAKKTAGRGLLLGLPWEACRLEGGAAKTDKFSWFWVN